ncbi:PLP-dependent transferase [Aspergillus novofumigatus IBT 16806]|uniref:PLP-dependent transferase n=1 Tax=Aspergillus novofumigatus (strain IBT 16806) TaxID=1392255 RepID=A0A2I1C151_ASPN1|nr:PLP-dependent transferase [Aspergillus novofumigatus IBT 16806]PKX91311.1 PLP-dependent transferase [Aspergillus novofumigatus IBT 16806]
MWILYHLSITLLLCFSHTGAIEFLQANSLSPRAENAIFDNQGWKNLSRDVLSKPYDGRKFPNGMCFIIDPLYHLTYGQGAAGSPLLRRALAKFFNTYFHPHQPVNESEIIIASGVTALIDSIAWCTCRDNERIVVPQPLYNGFPTDMRLRSQGKLLPASFMWDNQTYSLDEVFNATAITNSLERTWKNYTESENKTTIREALIAIARFCGKHKIHFISDEIYANSVFTNPRSNATGFTSVLSLNLDGFIDPKLVHVMYGMSKDFGASGLRLGVLHSRNADLIQAAYGVNLFSWPSYLAQDMWGRLLEDTNKTRDFLNENKQLLGKAYGIVTEWLRNNSIEYFDRGLVLLSSLDSSNRPR